MVLGIGPGHSSTELCPQPLQFVLRRGLAEAGLDLAVLLLSLLSSWDHRCLCHRATVPSQATLSWTESVCSFLLWSREPCGSRPVTVASTHLLQGSSGFRLLPLVLPQSLVCFLLRSSKSYKKNFPKCSVAQPGFVTVGCTLSPSLSVLVACGHHLSSVVTAKAGTVHKWKPVRPQGTPCTHDSVHGRVPTGDFHQECK